MIQLIKFAIVLTLIVASAPRAIAQIENKKENPFSKPSKPIQIPEDLKATYNKFIKTLHKTDAEKLLPDFFLPGSIRITTAERKKDKKWNICDEINMPFVKSGDFQSEISHAKKESDECYILTTQSSSFWFCQTKSGKWMIYKTYDAISE